MIYIDTQKTEFKKLKEISIFDKNEQEQKLNGNLLLIGLGGVGTDALREVKGLLKDKITPEDNIEFMIIDSDIPAMEDTIEQSKEGLGFNATEVVSIYRPNLENLLTDAVGRNNVYLNFAKWFPENFPEVAIGTTGTKQSRPIGRLMLANAYEDVRTILFERINFMYRKSALKRLDVVLVTNLGGGTGSGILTDIAYNIKAYARSQQMTNFRLGAVCLTPDVLYADNISDIAWNRMNANSLATLKEISYYMSMNERDEAYTYQNGEMKLSMKENMLDSCMLISGRKDQNGYIPKSVVYSDLAYFMVKLTSPKYVGGEEFGGGHKNLRDVFFRKNDENAFKVINETDFKVPIREIENLNEYEVFREGFKLFCNADDAVLTEKYINPALEEIRTFIEGKPGDDINLKVNGLINTTFIQKPVYKDIKKNRDNLRNSLQRDVENMKPNIPGIAKNIETKLWKNIDDAVARCDAEFGPIATLHMIGAKGFAGIEEDKGLVKAMMQLSSQASEYHPTGEFGRVIDSIKQMTAKRFFAFPKARKETEEGYFDACLKEALENERTVLIEGIEDSDLFGDTVRWLRQVAERSDDIYSQLSADLEGAMEALANDSKRVLSFMLKDSKQSNLLPSDYVTSDRLRDMRDQLVRLYNDNKTNIENDRPLVIKEYMERIFKNFFAGIGVYSAEKFLYMSYAEGDTSLQELNQIFVAAKNDKRDNALRKAAESFVRGARDKVVRKKMTNLIGEEVIKCTYRKYISLPEAMPHFSDAVREILTSPLYGESDNNIAVNPGDLSITEDEIVSDMHYVVLAFTEEMQQSYDELVRDGFIHTDNLHDFISY